MALTTRQRLRLMVDDQQAYFQDTASGDAVGSVFFLSHYPVYPHAGTAGTIWLNGTVQGTAAYTVDWQHGRLTFGTAPLNGGTVQADYLAVTLTDDEVDDAYIYAGGSANLEAAAAELWRIKAGRHAAHYSFNDAGQSFSRGEWTKACQEMAKLYEAKSTKRAQTGGVWAAGISEDAKEVQRDDSDRVQNRFRKDQFSNPGTTDSIDDLDAE